MSLTKKWLHMDDEIKEIENTIRSLGDTLKRLRAQQDEIKMKIIEEYDTNGVVPDNGLILKKVPPKLIVTDESKLPDKFFKIERKLNKAELNREWKAGNMYDGCAVDNGGMTVAIQAIKNKG